MVTRNHPFLLTLLLLATLARTVLGAPCCMELISTQGEVYSAHSEPASHGHASHHQAGHDHVTHNHSAHQTAHLDHSSDHEGHDGDNTANPCCSACGPTLPPELAHLAALGSARARPEPAPVRALKTRPAFPAYEARGPPVLI